MGSDKRRLNCALVVAAGMVWVVGAGVGCSGGDGQSEVDSGSAVDAAGQLDGSTQADAAGQQDASTQTDSGQVDPFTLTSTAFANNANIPAIHSCDGTDTSPPLTWINPPAGTVSFALVVEDTDAGNFLHWAAGGIPATTLSLATGASPGDMPPGSWEINNSFGTTGWRGPCPPPNGPHHYIFTLYALDCASLPVEGEFGRSEVLAALKGHVLAESAWTGTYTLNPALA